jgi:hypothetical protein
MMSHCALELVYMCSPTSIPSTSSNSPAGIQYLFVLLSLFGTGLPQVAQKSERKPVSLMHERKLSRTDNHL